MARLKQYYQEEIVPRIKEKFAFTNTMRVPRVEKVVVNMGIGAGISDAKAVQAAADDLALIVGQKPVVTRARKSIAGFKLREGMPVGCRVTLRGERMYEFLDRLISVALPRIRDFRGLPVNLDGHGNYTLGLEEQIVFPEVDIDKVYRVQGMNITVVTSTESDEEAKELLSLLGMPFADRRTNV
ncbi:MAG TPA: 50S ribosomal protein L5 [bacterium]|nr:50S ribosomal protein L5 [bacterium]HPJ71473.1 50S ribosomal protein L5 [bacterium]HPQ65962.1 50S ribosomal protein L5 [bacterium]